VVATLLELTLTLSVGLAGFWLLFFGDYVHRPIARWHDRLRGAALVSPFWLRVSGRDYRTMIRFLGAVLIVGFLILLLDFARKL
jgi:hypothetical protein